MSYREEFNIQSLGTNRWPEEVSAKIKAAVEAGKVVEWEFSSFTDPRIWRGGPSGVGLR